MATRSKTIRNGGNGTSKASADHGDIGSSSDNGTSISVEKPISYPSSSSGALARVDSGLKNLASKEPTVRATKSSQRKSTAEQPSDDEIARRAYEIYQRRGCKSGHDVEDWLEAKRELLAERSPTR